MKYIRFSALFFGGLLVFWQSGLATTAYNKNYANHSVRKNSHSHPPSEVRKCKLPEEEEMLNGNRSLKMFFAGARRNGQFGKSPSIMCEKPVTHLISYPHITSNTNQHFRESSMLILFPFHAFW